MSRSPRLRRGDLLPRLRASRSGSAPRATIRRGSAAETPGLAPPLADDALLWSEARGANVLDADGNRYIDLTAGFGVAAVGHRHPAVVAAIKHQAGRLIHGLGDAQGHPLRLELAARLRRLAPIDDARVAFAVSGSDAVELAVKTALLATGRPRVLAFEPAYHGLTLGALTLSSRPSFRRVAGRHLHRQVRRLPFGGEIDEIAATLADEAFAAAIVEPIVGREGVLVPPSDWLAALAAACKRHGTLLIVDEIFTGFGRTGRWFAVGHEGVEPDLLCCGKALGGGMPLAAVLGRAEVMAAWAAPGEARHTATFVAQPLACAAALASLDTLRSERLIARAARLGRRLHRTLAEWPSLTPALVEVRGRGALWGLEFSSAEAAAGFADAARRRGILLLAGGAAGRVAQLVPPLTISDHQLEHALETLADILAANGAAGEAPGKAPGKALE